MTNAKVGSHIGDNPYGTARLGVIRLEGWGAEKTTGTGDTGYVPIRGDIDDQRSLSFPATASIAEGCTWDNLKDPSKWDDPNHLAMIRKGLAASFKELVEEGSDVVVSNCGLFMWCHAKNIVPYAMDDAMDALAKEGNPNPRPIVQLSTLTYLAGMLPLYGLGPGGGAGRLEPKPKIAIFTSNEVACMGILQATPQLQGTKFFIHSDPAQKRAEGEVLVVGLNGDNVIGVNGPVDGFEVVNDGTPAFYETLQPAIQKVAEGVKREYPSVVMGIVECTEVGAYTDTIRHAMSVPVYDPIHLTETGMDAIVDHEYKQLSNADRTVYINSVLSYPVKVSENMPYYVDLADGEENEDPDKMPAKKSGDHGYSEKDIANHRLRHMKKLVADSKKKGMQGKHGQQRGGRGKQAMQC